ncbi:MAG: CaiB/BaiF CoA-transferase family protein [Actinomycetota bacterium]|jgi:crotonobetainyl-CoA:carnitine CoA-transferase CaiB-like acyl-CoA transferase|nr:CaiB/BaiF CoA-transferase family protein [Actinomycetota bacterium]MEE3256492.1 CaiB/BaiF CoA-transferase family protein [Actinomycetota bacterium]
MTNQTNSPLAGIKVVEITSIYSGPMAGMMLGELGAQVVKVESPGSPDPLRASGLGPGPDGVNSIFYSLNRGKRFCSIDAKTDRGRELLFDLVAGADVFIHNMRPGKAEGLGLDYDALSKLNPGIIYGAITGHGPEGPEAHLPAYDYVVQAKLGMVDYQRDREGRGDLVRQVVVDKTSANALVQGVLAALYMREKTGRGQRVEIPMVAAGLAFLWPDGLAAAHAELNPAIPLDQMPPWLESAPGSFLVVLETADGEIATGIMLPPWDGLCLALERTDWLTDERFSEALGRVLNLPELIAEVSSEVAKYTTEEILARFEEHDFAAGKVVTRREVHEDPTIKHLGLITEQAAPGLGQVRQPAPMWMFSDATTEVTTSLNSTGGDSREVLAELGVSEDEFAELEESGVVFVATAEQ